VKSLQVRAQRYGTALRKWRCSAINNGLRNLIMATTDAILAVQDTVYQDMEQ
jgi:hypothetical protein